MSYQQKFQSEFERLNQQQRQAVNQTDGPVMVVAGPGTGKTQLLAMRVANILKKTDTDASSILCLTFTESAASNMTKRMANIFGAEAYRVAVHTFHGLGSEIINYFGQYFYNGAVFRAASDLNTIKIVENILAGLPHDNPLSSKMNGQFTYLNAVISAISDIKRAGLLPSEMQELIDQNLTFLREITPSVREVFSDRISKQTITAAERVLQSAEALTHLNQQKPFTTEPPLATLFKNSLEQAINQAEEINKPAPLTAWKKQYIGKNDIDEIILKDQAKTEKLAALNEVYRKYLEEMLAEGLYDYDDMILRVVHALEIFPSLKAELQERYQYILVDEFQDTNDAQMRLLRALTDYDAKPNIMVVGDDDQAIFRFQGADISNIQSFNETYQVGQPIVLTENYRSSREILSLSGEIADKIDIRLNKLLHVSKDLASNTEQTGKINQFNADTIAGEYEEVSKRIQADIKSGIKPDKIAVIARRHKGLMQILPFLTKRCIAVDYEHEEDALALPPVQILELVSRIVLGIASRDDAMVDSLLPKLSAHPAWQIEPKDIWQISLQSNRNHKFWLETMLEYSDQTKSLAEWLILLSSKSHNEPLETMLDTLIGVPTKDAVDNFRSPIYDYYFAKQNLEKDSSTYLDLLQTLTKLRQAIRDYRPEDGSRQLLLNDFIDIIDMYKDLNKTLPSTRRPEADGRVQMLSAHKAKGLEFDSVYIINATSQSWGEKSRGGTSLISFPSNMPFAIAGDSSDERLRLLFVALTRAKFNLTISAHTQNESGKEVRPLEYLVDCKNVNLEDLLASTEAELTDQLETAWHGNLTNTHDQTTKADLLNALSDKLSTYQLSATHLNNFIDITRSGPEVFLMQDLLRFPSARSASASFGTAIHSTLQRAHTHLTIKGHVKPFEDILGDFETILHDMPLTDQEFEFYLKKGMDALRVFVEQRITSFSPDQIVERSFSSDNIHIGEARLTGKIDLIDINKSDKTIVVTDYKTGKASLNWHGKDDFERIKLHKYRQQLLFYKLLIENSRQFKGYTVKKGVLEFVEPYHGEIQKLEIDYDDTDMTEFTELIQAVWHSIINLDLPTIDSFAKNYEGVIAFEESLLNGS